MFMAGCAVVKPNRSFETVTPVDCGLSGAYLGTAAVIPFDAKENDDWGVYTARRLTEYLMESRAFRQVVLSDDSHPKTGYLVTGTLEHVSYGGSDGPTTVFLSVQVASASDSRVRFLRTVKASSGKSAFHMTWLRMVDVPSPYIEEVLNGILRDVAADIASRTHSPAVQNP